jgi:hypothetical protein
VGEQGIRGWGLEIRGSGKGIFLGVIFEYFHVFLMVDGLGFSDS